MTRSILGQGHLSGSDPGWFFPYAVAAVAGVNVCLRKVVANDIFAAVKEHRVTHICGAPIVMSTMYFGGRHPKSIESGS